MMYVDKERRVLTNAQRVVSLLSGFGGHIEKATIHKPLRRLSQKLSSWMKIKKRNTNTVTKLNEHSHYHGNDYEEKTTY